MEATAQSLSRAGECQAVLDSYFAAIRCLDLDRIVAHYAPDIIAYDAISSLAFAGSEAYKVHWKACLAHCQSMIFEVPDLSLTVSGDLAVAHALVRCGGVTQDGEEVSGWMRGTIALRRQDNGWLIFHEHYSSPFDPETHKVLDLQPKA